MNNNKKKKEQIEKNEISYEHIYFGFCNIRHFIIRKYSVFNDRAVSATLG